MQKFKLKWHKDEPFTKELALYLCMRLWFWLACHPGKGKAHWPAWLYNGGSVSHSSSSCPCCEYEIRQLPIEISCKVCPLLDFWPNTSKINPCTEPHSPYLDWENAIGLKRIWPALRIAWAAKRELKRCLKEAA